MYPTNINSFPAMIPPDQRVSEVNLTHVVKEDEDPDRKVFEEYAANYPINYIQWVPLRSLIQYDIQKGIENIRIQSEEIGVPLLKETWNIYSNSIVERSSKGLIEHINKNLIPKMNIDILIKMLNLASKVLEKGRDDMLSESIHSILKLTTLPDQNELATATIHQFRILLRTFQSMAESVNMNGFEQQLCRIHNGKHPRENFKEICKENRKLLKQVPNLTTQRQKDLVIVFNNLVFGLSKEIPLFMKYLDNIFTRTMQNHYGKVIDSDSVGKMILTKTETCDTLPYVESNRAFYDSFIPVVEESRAWIMERSKSIKEKCSLLKDFILYIKLGNLDSIIKLPQTYQSTSQLTLLISNEIKNFQKQYKDELPLTHKILKEITGNPFVKLQRYFYSCAENFFSHAQLVSEHVLEVPLKVCRQMSVHFPTPPSLHNVPHFQTVREIASENQNETNESESSEETHSSSTSTSSQYLEELKTKTPNEVLNALREVFAMNNKSLLTMSKKMGYRDAVNNSFDQFEDLLTEAARFVRQINKPLLKEELLSTVVNFINHGTLLIEQSLTALLCKSLPAFKDKQELKNAFSHDLIILLNSCEWNKFPLSNKTRKTIQQTNLGEIFSRDLVVLAENKSTSLSSVKELLGAAYSWSLSQDSVLPEKIMHAALDYFANVLHAYRDIQIHIKTDATEKGLTEVNDKQVARMISMLKRKLLQQSRSIQLDSQKQNSHTVIKSIQNALSELINRADMPFAVQTGLKHLQSSLLLRLNTELQFQSDLPYKEIRLHYCHVMLLDQYIAEEFLYQLIACENMTVDPSDIHHDLMQLVGLLGYSAKDFPADVQQFLKCGHEVRSLMRYRFNFYKEGDIQDNIRNVSKLAQTQVFGDKKSDGFQIVENKKGGMDAMLKDIQTHVFALEKLILFLCKKYS